MLSCRLWPHIIPVSSPQVKFSQVISYIPGSQTFLKVVTKIKIRYEEANKYILGYYLVTELLVANITINFMLQTSSQQQDPHHHVLPTPQFDAAQFMGLPQKRLTTLDFLQLFPCTFFHIWLYRFIWLQGWLNKNCIPNLLVKWTSRFFNVLLLWMMATVGSTPENVWWTLSFETLSSLNFQVAD